MNKFQVLAVSATSALALAVGTPASAMFDHHEEAADAMEDETATSETTMEDAEAASTEDADAVTVGGAEMLPTRNIVENAANSPIHTTLVQAVQTAELVETLSGEGPFTVFAPTDEAFGLIPAETLQALMAPAARAQLTSILTYHVVPGALDAEALMAQIEAGGGTATLTTVEGSPLTASVVNDAIAITDERNGVAYVTQADVTQSNGVIHVLNGVMLPDLNAAPPAEGASD